MSRGPRTHPSVYVPAACHSWPPCGPPPISAASRRLPSQKSAPRGGQPLDTAQTVHTVYTWRVTGGK